MEFKKLDDNKFQCLLEKEDLEENHISLDDFFKNDTAKIHGLLSVVMEEAQKEIDVEMDGGVMSLQLAPQPNQSILLTISSAQDDFGEMLRQAGERVSRSLLSNTQKKPSESNVIKNPKNGLSAAPFKDLSEQKQQKQKKKQSENVVKAATGVFCFHSMDDVEDFCMQSPRTWGIQNELYKDIHTGTFYLILRKGRCAEQKFKNICTLLMEYAECEPSGELRARWLEEHCQKMIAGNAVNTIKKYCGGNYTC